MRISEVVEHFADEAHTRMEQGYEKVLVVTLTEVPPVGGALESLSPTVDDGDPPEEVEGEAA